MTSAELASAMGEFVCGNCERAVERYVPGLVIPRTFAGLRISDDFAVDCAYTLKYLHRAGVNELGGRGIGEIVRTLLLQIDGEKTETFYSYRIAETLKAFGGLSEENVLWRGLTAGQRENLLEAIDSTFILNEWGKPLGGRPNNYWGVLARCEYARKQLGVLKDKSVLDLCVEKVRGILFANEAGFFDDSREMAGRFDIYSPDVQLFLEPLWGFFEGPELRRNLRAHVKLLETLALESGAFVAWGRSVGLLTVCLTMEFGAIALREKLAEDEGRMVGLIANAFEKAKGWFEEGLTNAHRGRMTDGYRGPHRLLQMTFDCLGKVAYAAEVLGGLETKIGRDDAVGNRTGVSNLFPARDVFVELGSGKASGRKAGVWMYRNGVVEFQLPVVDGGGADYVPWLHAPGLFENPVDSSMVCGVPRIWAGQTGESVLGTGAPKWESEYASAGLPVAIEKCAGGMTLTYDGYVRTAGKEGPTRLEGRRVVEYRVEGDAVVIREKFFVEAGGAEVRAISYVVPEVAGRKLSVEFETGSGHVKSVVTVKGISMWRSVTGEIGRVHQVEFIPPRTPLPLSEGFGVVELVTTIVPAVKVAQGPSDHDYNRAQYDYVTSGMVEERGFSNGICGEAGMSVEKVFGDAEVVHVGWPEHLFSPHGLKEEDFDKRWDGFLAKLAASGKKVVWTMHNRRPHMWAKERGVGLYRRFAAVVDACLHHSKWGEKVMRSEYAFKPGCEHYVVPHMHFGPQMRTGKTREELERQFGLPACGVRIGLLGRYQKEKQIEMILECFGEVYSGMGRKDLQLVTTSYREDVVLPEVEGVIKLPRGGWMLRGEIAEHTQVCDVLISAHMGDTYLTSGLVGDAVGMGVAMLVPEWEFFREILGDAAMYHDNTQAGLTAALGGLTAEKVAEAKAKTVALQAAYSPETVGKRLTEILREVRLGDAG